MANLWTRAKMFGMSPTTPTQLETARQTAGRNGKPMSYNDLRDAVIERIGRAMTPTAETLRQMHREDGTKAHDPVVLAAVADVYGLTLADVDPEAVGQVKRVAAFLQRAARSRCASEGVQPTLPGFDGSVWVGAKPPLSRLEVMAA